MKFSNERITWVLEAITAARSFPHSLIADSPLRFRWPQIPAMTGSVSAVESTFQVQASILQKLWAQGGCR